MVNQWNEKEINYLINNYLNKTDEELARILTNHTVKSIADKRLTLRLVRPCHNKKYIYSDFKRVMDNKGYIIISDESEFANCGTPMKYICPKHKDKGIQKTTLGKLNEGKGCKYCGIEKCSQSRIKAISNEKREKVYTTCKDRNWDFIKFDRVKQSDGRIKQSVFFICSEHKDYGIQNVPLDNFFRNKKCKYCQHKSLSIKDITKMANKGNPNIIILSQFKRINDYVDCVCVKHNYNNYIRVGDIIDGGGCYYCGMEKLSKSCMLDEKDVDEKILSINPNIIRVGDYKGVVNLMKLKCKKCNHEWESSLINVKFCPNCENEYISFGEQAISTILKEKGIVYISQKTFDSCKNKRVLPFDFYIPKYNVCIEYQGRQHYEPVEYFGGEKSFTKQILNDNIKRKFCKNNNIKLVEIPYKYDTKDKIKKVILDSLEI